MVGVLKKTSNRSKGAGQLMIVIVFIAIAAGCASALMFASIISGALISLLLFYLAPLPLMVAALGWGPLCATFGGTAAAAGIGAIFGLPYCIAFPSGLGLPAGWLGPLVSWARPANRDAWWGDDASPAAPDLEWYPVGRILLWIAGFVAMTTMAALLTVGTDAATITDALRRFLQRILDLRDVAPTPETEQLINAFVPMAPAAAPTFARTTPTLNLSLAPNITTPSLHLPLPRPPLR